MLRHNRAMIYNLNSFPWNYFQYNSSPLSTNNQVLLTSSTTGLRWQQKSLRQKTKISAWLQATRYKWGNTFIFYIERFFVAFFLVLFFFQNTNVLELNSLSFPWRIPSYFCYATPADVWKQQPDSLSFSPPPVKHIPFIHRNSTWLKLPSVETYHSHPRLLDRSHWAVRPMPSVWVGREPPGRPGLMSPWASKPRGPIALGNVANQGCTLALVPPSSSP